MYKLIQVLLLISLPCLKSGAQALPLEGRQLNYRLVGFACEKGPRGSKYKIEIALGNYDVEDSFSQHIFKTYKSDSNKIIGEVPYFGYKYTWRTITTIRSKSSYSRLYHFATKLNPDVDTNMTRLRITTKSTKHRDAYVFLDGTKALYDMDGKAVWFLDNVSGIPTPFLQFRDLKITQQGTITFMSDFRNGMIYEVNYNGDILWKAESADLKNTNTDEHFHHEFTRLGNGHYMTTGNDIVLWKLPVPIDSALRNRPDIKGKIVSGANNEFYERILLGTIIEYDEAGAVVWRWRSSQYFKQGADVYYKTGNTGIYDIDDTHLNSFYFDEKEKAIYVGFRDISRVIKVGYPSGQVLKEFGNLYIRGVKDTANEMFCWQHSCKHSPNGYMYLFNNNTCHHGSMPRITIVRDSTPDDGSTKKMWEYECTIDGVESNHQYQFANGGSVTELPDQSIFVNMSHELYTKVFIIDRDKNYDWSAIPERWNEKEKKWAPVFQYRASIINRQDLERMIWNEMNNR